MKILPEMYVWTRKTSVNFGSNLDRDPDLGIFEVIFILVI